MKFNDIAIKNILRDKWTYISYFLSSVFSILVFFLFLITAFHPMLDTIKPNSSLGSVLIFSGFIVYVFSFVFIVYSMLTFLKKKTKSLGVFMISGASMKQLKKMVFLENMIIAIAAIITSIVIGLIISPLFLMVVKNVLDADSFGMYAPIQAIGVTLILFSILFLILSKFTARFIKKEEAIHLLKADVTQEKQIPSGPFKLLLSITISAILLITIKISPNIVERLGVLFLVLIIISLLITIYFILTQGILFVTHRLQKSVSDYKKTKMLFVSNLRAKGNSYAHIIYLLAILLLAVFVGTSVLYSSYYNVEESTEAVYPHSMQYISLPENPPEQKQKDIQFIETTFNQEGEDYITYESAFKTDVDRRIAFMSNTNFNSLGSHKEINLDKNEYYVVAGNEGEIPNTELIKDYLSNDLQYKGLQEEMMLTTSLQNVYYIVSEEIYESLKYPEYEVFAYELENWTEKLGVIDKVESKISTTPNQRLVTSKISLYDTENFTKSMIFLIGFMLSLIFLSAAMSIIYFYLQSTLEGEKEKYKGIRKIGLSIKEISSVVTKELLILIFVPFTFSTMLLFIVLIILRSVVSPAFYQVTAIGVGIFLLLFILSFLIVRKVYLKKLVE